MKKNLLLLIISIMVAISCIGNRRSQTEQSDTIPVVQTDTIPTAQTDSLTEEEAIVQMLIEFYTVYNKTWTESGDPYILIGQLDSLRQRYCTQRFKKEAFDEYLDHDILICDFSTKDLETINVTKDNVRESTYWVSYTSTIEDFKNKKHTYNIQIQLVMVKEDGEFKIDEVLNPFGGFFDLSNK